MIMPAFQKAPEALSVETMPSAIFGRVDVYFDGININCVVAYDCNGGWVEAFEHDEAGEPIVEGGRLKVRRLHGRVVAILRQKI
ncbi:hypothetical protein [Sphingobium yanoikuyae]|uniref:Uncharacterized protein n=1 Tax=Sphingobium yanoikuyae TaxID=13690 RepID=A0A0J9CV68_SPHYA|nr:hypothetical protein [Sphingobium yanoikuyae]ATP20394.1 hypothetical protein BV87_19775 [Sphingobium yanoikuyae]KMW29013.1 hypothetical protein BV87_16190 [Sphingobium yanoikuyae]